MTREAIEAHREDAVACLASALKLLTARVPEDRIAEQLLLARQDVAAASVALADARACVRPALRSVG